MTEPHHCQRFTDDLSGLVDHTLSPRRLARVREHLESCADCRENLAAIRALRDRLSAGRVVAPAAPSSLTQRLEGIAGGESDQPLYLTTGSSKDLLTRSQRLGRTLTRSGVATVVVLVTLLGLGLALGQEPTTLEDPVGSAREQYSQSIAAISVNEAVGAAMSARQRGMRSAPVRVEPRAVVAGRPQPLSEEKALALLTGDRHRVSYSGTQRVWLGEVGDSYQVHDVGIDVVAGQGAGVTVRDDRGRVFLSWFVPALGCCDAAAEPGRRFHTYREQTVVAGRAARLVEAHRGDQVVARWWVDAEHDVVLWFERYDSRGVPVVVAGYVSIRFGETEIHHDEAAPQPMLQAATSADRDGWCRGLPSCPTHLAGLPLVAFATSDDTEAPWQRLVYSDGMRTVSVSWTSGVLPEGTRVDDDSRGQPHVSAWQAGDGVISVATTDSRALLVRACGELPTEQEHRFSLADRIGSGWRRLLGIG
ncbi:anti-sigma factor [Arachnia propionica]|uniref:Zf-HC2 domain-containing protein n=1 Tax=Arachnia propionica TaxID=1750 RepID=A0A3P1X0A8_9ACTN|nr:zf-HC2 domain-containing protein [Arachnia propionica]RRD51407.1 zf-HC2 domain-containing protein [Arachnia propionica]